MREVWKKIFCDTNLGWGGVEKTKKKMLLLKLLKKRKNSIKFYIN